MKQIKSFTLIEVLIGIVVVGILSSFIIVSISSFVDDANDTKRKKDLDSIASSLLAYKTLTGSYPIEASDCNIGEESCLDELTKSGYATNFPIDPDGTKYTYTSDGTTYTIKASLSNNQTLTYNPDTGYSEYQGLAGLDGYAKRKSITVASSASLTNYQMKFIVHRSTGTDSGSNVYVSTNCQDDYDDIRFTNSSNQLLDYWIESSDSLSATIWVEADSLASGNTTLYLYYGNASATAVSNGDNTFEFFDDFATKDIDKWIWTNGGGSAGVSGGSAVISTFASSWTMLASQTFFEDPFVMESYFKTSSFGDTTGTNKRQEFFDVNESVYAYFARPDSSKGGKSSNYDGTLGTLHTITGWSANTFHRFKLTITGVESKIEIDGSDEYTHADRYNPSMNDPIRFYCNIASGGSGASSITVDWVFIRKYTTTEPSASWGSEENI